MFPLLTLTGCFIDAEYYKHKPTNNIRIDFYNSKLTAKKIKLNHQEFISNGVLFIPSFEEFSPKERPNISLILVSDSPYKVLIEKIKIDNSYEKLINKEVSSSFEPGRLYNSAIRLEHFTEFKDFTAFKDFIETPNITFEIYYSIDGGAKRKMSFELQQVLTKDVNW